jgi:hypothetical protein
MRRIAPALLALAATAAAPALADIYPIAGRFGASTWTQQGPIDCAGLRVVTFIGNQRRDTGGGVAAFRNRSVTPIGAGLFEVVDEFTTGQVYYAHANYDLQIVDADRIALDLQPGGVLKLQRCR